MFTGFEWVPYHIYPFNFLAIWVIPGYLADVFMEGGFCQIQYILKVSYNLYHVLLELTM